MGPADYEIVLSTFWTVRDGTPSRLGRGYCCGEQLWTDTNCDHTLAWGPGLVPGGH